MARLARVSVPGFPYHVTHRGNHGAPIFFDDEDREVYLALLDEYARRYSLKLWAYCLMTNHVHLLVAPELENSMAYALGRGAHALCALGEQKAEPRRASMGKPVLLHRAG